MSNNIDLDKFNHLEVTLDVEKILKKYGRQAAKELKQNPSVSPRIKEHRKTNEYFSTWQSRYDKGTHTAVVYNKKNGRLTYLLENGHFITNKRGGLGWAKPHPHISIVYDKLKSKFVADMEKVDIKVKLY